jgi:hypothetical protein
MHSAYPSLLDVEEVRSSILLAPTHLCLPAASPWAAGSLEALTGLRIPRRRSPKA